MRIIHNQVTELATEVADLAKTKGSMLAINADKSSAEIILWINYFRRTGPDKPAFALLQGVQAALIETGAYLALGLGRAAICAIRTQIDLLLGYSYFADHPREWAKVEDTGDGFMLKKEIYNYHREIDKPGFNIRLELIEHESGISLDTVYRRLSAHIHSQSSFTAPQAEKMIDLVSKPPFLESVVQLHGEAAIAISDFLASVYAPNWPDLPPPIVRRIRDCIPKVKQSKFFT